MSLSSPDKVHGIVIANASLLKSLVAVLPLEALRALLPELERDTEFAKDFLLSQGLTDAGIDAYAQQADANLAHVRQAIAGKEALQNPDAALRWIREQLRSNDQD